MISGYGMSYFAVEINKGGQVEGESLYAWSRHSEALNMQQSGVRASEFVVQGGKYFARLRAQKAGVASSVANQLSTASVVPTHCMVAKSSSLLEEVLLLKDAQRALTLHQAYVRRSEEMTLKVRCAQANSSTNADEDGIYLRPQPGASPAHGDKHQRRSGKVGLML
jgi:hypothetical protein